MWVEAPLLSAKCQLAYVRSSIPLIELYVGDTTNSKRKAGGNGTCRQMGLGNGCGIGLDCTAWQNWNCKWNWSTSGTEWSVAKNALAVKDLHDPVLLAMVRVPRLPK